MTPIEIGDKFSLMRTLITLTLSFAFLFTQAVSSGEILNAHNKTNENKDIELIKKLTFNIESSFEPPQLTGITQDPYKTSIFFDHDLLADRDYFIILVNGPLKNILARPPPLLS